jgi:hypothetical protein
MHLALNSETTSVDDASEIFLFEVVLSEYIKRIEIMELRYQITDEQKDGN